MVHWCSDESLALMSTVPVIGIFFRKIHKWYHKMTHHQPHQQQCLADLSPPQEPLMPNPPARDIMSMQEVDNHFGQLATILLMFDRPLLQTEHFPSRSQFTWFLSPDDTLSARLDNKFFVWDGKEWKKEVINEQDAQSYHAF